MIARKVFVLSLLLLSAGSARAQVGVRKDDVVLTSRGSPAGGVSVSICTTGLATTGAQIIGGSIAVLTFGSSPISAGFVTGMGLTVSGFSGADSFLNGSHTIASVTSTTVSYALTHSNYTASSNGIAFQTGNASTPCAPLAQIFSDGNLTMPIAQPGLTADGIGNYGYWAAPGQYMAQFGGPVLTTKVLPVTLPCPPNSTCPGVGSGGTVTSLSAGNLSPLFTSSVATPTSTPALSFTLNSQSANLFFAAPNGSSGVPSFRAMVGADVPATTSNCSGVQFAQGLNAGHTPVCATPPTFVASGASHAVGYVPDPGSSAGTTRFLREDATWVAPSSSGVSEATWTSRSSRLLWRSLKRRPFFRTRTPWRGSRFFCRPRFQAALRRLFLLSRT